MGMSCIFASNASSQNAKVNIQVDNASLKDVITQIERQTNYLFVYNNQYVNLSKKVSIKESNSTVTKVLDNIFKESNITYVVEGNNILLMNRDMSPQQHPLQKEVKISGTVTDESGEPIIGANVRIKDQGTGTITDIDGYYTLTVPEDAIIQVSYIGYISLETPVRGKTTINIKLKEDAVGLEEVVIIGYGVTKRENFAGSVSSIKLEDSPITLTPTANVLNLLQGTVAGVTINRSGEADGVSSMQVRGQRSISNTSSDPLLVVDGLIFDGSINDLDVNSIDNVTVLKDASTLATYGTRAANGVVMITTKKGQKGKPIITFNPSIAISQPNYRPKMRSPQGYIELMNRRSGLAPDADPTWMGELERANYERGETTDWVDYISRTGVLQNYSLNFSGATDKSNYFMSANHWDQKGNYYGDDFKRNTFTARINTDINDYISIGTNVNVAFNKSVGVKPSYGNAVTLTPYGEPELQNGNMRKYPDGKESTTVNPLWNTFNGIDQERRGSTLIVGGYLNIKIPKIEGLSYKITGSYTKRTSERRRFTHETNFPDMNLGEDGYTTEVFDTHLREANGYIDSQDTKSWVLDNILTYYRTIDKHYINATFVYTRDEQKVEQQYVSGSDFRKVGNTSLGIHGLPNAEVQKMDRFTYARKANIGYLGRLNYSYDDKYHLNLSVRRDGSSVFGKNKKWGVFPSIGGAWSISREDFMKDISQIDDLKLKISWGKNGNQSLTPYRTLSLVSMGRGGNQVYYFGNEVAYGQMLTSLGNPELGWEETTSLNYGFEADLWNHRLHTDVNIYHSSTRNQIFTRKIPPMGSGLTTQDATMGQINNWGIELNVSGSIINQKNFRWNSGLIFTLNRNKLVELYGDGQDDITNGLFIGKSLGAIYGYVWDGIVQAGEENYVSNLVATPGDAKYADLNGDNKLTAEDRKILGYSKENFRMSMTHTLSYKNFTLYMLFNGVFGGNGYGKARNNSAYLTEDTYFYHNTLDHPYWTPENPSNKYPRWSFSDDRFVALQSYTYVRLQDLNLAYTFNNNVLGKLGLSGLKVYVAGSNLLFFAPNWDGSDPEVRNYSAAQLQRTITFGLNFKF